MNYKDLTAPDLVKQWRRLVNDNVMFGRDAHLVKDFLLLATPVQVLLGMYQYKDIRTVTIPQFLRQWESWLIEDEAWAEVELACYVARQTPPEYYIYKDLVNEQNSEAFFTSIEARLKLREWSEGVLT